MLSQSATPTTPVLARLSSCFAAFEPSHLERIEALGLRPATKTLFIYLHSLAPFGRFYSWSRPKGIFPTAIAHKLGYVPRTIFASIKELRDQKLVAFRKDGFRILAAYNRTTRKAEEQLNLFSWAQTGSNDHARPLKPNEIKASGGGKESLSISTYTYTDQTKHPPNHPACGKASFSGNPKPKPASQNSSPSSPVKKKVQLKDQSHRRGSRFRRDFSLEEKYFVELEKIGIPRWRVNRNLVKELEQHTWESFLAAAAYTKSRAKQIQIPNLCGYLITAMRQKYALEAAKDSHDEIYPEQMEWRELASKKGLVMGSQRSPADGRAMEFRLRGFDRFMTYEECLVAFPVDLLLSLSDADARLCAEVNVAVERDRTEMPANSDVSYGFWPRARQAVTNGISAISSIVEQCKLKGSPPGQAEVEDNRQPF